VAVELREGRERLEGGRNSGADVREAGFGARVCTDGEKGWIREGVQEGLVRDRVRAVITVNILAARRGVPDDAKTVDVVENITSCDFIEGFASSVHVFLYVVSIFGNELGKIMRMDLLG
jgi:hypothetical protein